MTGTAPASMISNQEIVTTITNSVPHHQHWRIPQLYVIIALTKICSLSCPLPRRLHPDCDTSPAQVHCLSSAHHLSHYQPHKLTFTVLRGYLMEVWAALLSAATVVREVLTPLLLVLPQAPYFLDRMETSGDYHRHVYLLVQRKFNLYRQAAIRILSYQWIIERYL